MDTWKSLLLVCLYASCVHCRIQGSQSGPKIPIMFPGAEPAVPDIRDVVDIRVALPDPPIPDLVPTEAAEVESLPSDIDPVADSLVTIEDFLNYYEIDDLPLLEENLSVSSRFGGAAGSEIFVQDASQAACVPQDTIVNLELPQGATVKHFPTCVRVPRCGGCCTAEQHTCQAIKTDMLKLRVVKLSGRLGEYTQPERRRGRSRPKRSAMYEEVEVVRHLKCECNCNVKKDACTPSVHIYNPSTCNCDCKNKAEEEKCRNTTSHYWRKTTCECLCRNANKVHCSSGQTFSHETCSCV